MKVYNRSNLPLARALRKNMTPWERKLWYRYLSRYPVRFQRQKLVGQYIVDFYCARAMLAVELDGSGHYWEKAAWKDEERTEKLEAMGIQVLHFCNTDVKERFEGVCYAIDQAVKKRVYAMDVKKAEMRNP